MGRCHKQLTEKMLKGAAPNRSRTTTGLAVASMAGRRILREKSGGKLRSGMNAARPKGI
jgi:hypothetical protein